MTIEDIVARKVEFIGKKCEITVGLSGELLNVKTIGDIELWENCIMISFSDDPGGELVLPREEIIKILPNGFTIRTNIYSCHCP